MRVVQFVLAATATAAAASAAAATAVALPLATVIALANATERSYNIAFGLNRASATVFSAVRCFYFLRT